MARSWLGNRTTVMFRRGLAVGRMLVVLVAVFLAACETVPITGRQQLSLLGSSEMSALGAQEYETVLEENDVIRGTKQAAQVQTVGRKIQKAVEQYFADLGQAARLKDYDWQFNLIDSDEANAFCLPGGKVAVYSGILEITRNEAGLAVVMGHEVAHAIANHGSERMSQSLLTDLVGSVVGAALSLDDPATQEIFSAAYGYGTDLAVLLPFSRLHESEADHLGLIFMAMAGYDPHEAPRFWSRMAASQGKEDAPPEFLSTHPSDQTRIKDLEAQIPEALTYARGRKASGTSKR